MSIYRKKHDYMQRFQRQVIKNDIISARIVSFCASAQQIYIKSGFNELENKSGQMYGR